MVQQITRTAVAVSADHHQSDEGGQEDGSQHPNGYNHHRLHDDSSSHSRLQSEAGPEEERPRRLCDCPSFSRNKYLSTEGGGNFSLIG